MSGAVRIGGMLRQSLRFGVFVLLLVGVLALLNWAPELLQSNGLKRFPTVDAAARELHTLHIYLPTYMPEDLHLALPPSEVFAQTSPFHASVLHFTFRDSAGIGLVIQQTTASAAFRIEPLLRLITEERHSEISLKGRSALLTNGPCGSGASCSRLSWREAGTDITLIGALPPQELIKIAASMLPG